MVTRKELVEQIKYAHACWFYDGWQSESFSAALVALFHMLPERERLGSLTEWKAHFRAERGGE